MSHDNSAQVYKTTRPNFIGQLGPHIFFEVGRVESIGDFLYRAA